MQYNKIAQGERQNNLNDSFIWKVRQQQNYVGSRLVG